MKRGAAAYPEPQLLSGCAIGRLGARVPDSSVPRRLPRKAMPELRLVEQRPVECCWTEERFWTLLEATDKAFPCVLRQHDSKITMEGLTALCYAGGRAVMLRSKYVELINGRGGVQEWTRNLKTQSLNTLTAASASVCLILRATYKWVHVVAKHRFRTAVGCSAVVVSDHQYLSFLGYPLMYTHPARMVGSPLEVAQSRSLAGTGGDRDAIFEYVKAHFILLREAGWPLEEAFMNLGDFCSGGSYMGSVMWEVADYFGMRFSFRFCIEGSAKALNGHSFGWCGQRPQLVLTEAAAAPLETLRQVCPPGATIIAATVCNPLSSAATSKGGKEKASEVLGAYELAAICLEKAMALEPNFILFENVDNLRTDARLAQVWSDLQAICMRWDQTYEWTWQKVCPAELLRKPMARKRVLASARRRVPIVTTTGLTYSAPVGGTRPARKRRVMGDVPEPPVTETGQLKKRGRAAEREAVAVVCCAAGGPRAFGELIARVDSELRH